jgi:hypothetical protein
MELFFCQLSIRRSLTLRRPPEGSCGQVLRRGLCAMEILGCEDCHLDSNYPTESSDFHLIPVVPLFSFAH